MTTLQFAFCALHAAGRQWEGKEDAQSAEAANELIFHLFAASRRVHAVEMPEEQRVQALN